MQSVYGSEKQMHNEHKLITQNEKAQCQVLLEITSFRETGCSVFMPPRIDAEHVFQKRPK